MKATQVPGDGGPEEPDPVLMGVAGEVGVIGGDVRNAARQGESLAEAAKDELGWAVHEIRREAAESARDLSLGGKGEPHVRIDRQRRAGDGGEVVTGRHVGPIRLEGVVTRHRVSWGDDGAAPAAGT